ncbi:hypothetical protein K431DRAFT_70048 [Polychaeton citri CBS 116435]|uniref:Uncharacterized protein n=1 Tax=Polychaeton citri CBS 116435 TaxID=1314669 RepID=A0A9P4QB35_9PEZI|nr:hypothetical protein K431DRAFT_70048 [Polychaeton citri CBS 116435]
MPVAERKGSSYTVSSGAPRRSTHTKSLIKKLTYAAEPIIVNTTSEIIDLTADTPPSLPRLPRNKRRSLPSPDSSIKLKSRKRQRALIKDETFNARHMKRRKEGRLDRSCRCGHPDVIHVDCLKSNPLSVHEWNYKCEPINRRLFGKRDFTQFHSIVSKRLQRFSQARLTCDLQKRFDHALPPFTSKIL